MAFVLKSGKQVQLTLEVTDVDDNDIPLAGPTVWTSSDPSVVSVSDSGMATDPPGAGTGTATITATDTLADGGDTITGVLDIQVVAGDANVVNIVPGTPEDRP